MSSKLSTTLLVVEAMLLAYVTLLGVIITSGLLLPSLVGGSFNFGEIAIGTSIIVILGSGWRILFAYLVGGRNKARSVASIWWLLSAIGAALSVIAVTATIFGATPISGQFATDFVQLFTYGGFFLIPFLHLSFETWLRKNC